MLYGVMCKEMHSSSDILKKVNGQGTHLYKMIREESVFREVVIV